MTDIKRVLVPTNHEAPASNTKNPYSSQLSKFIMDKENDILQMAISKMNEINVRNLNMFLNTLGFKDYK